MRWLLETDIAHMNKERRKKWWAEYEKTATVKTVGLSISEREPGFLVTFHNLRMHLNGTPTLERLVIEVSSDGQCKVEERVLLVESF